MVAAGGAEDITPTTRIDVTKNGAAFPQSSVRYPVSGSGASAPIFIDGSGGTFVITVHRSAYRDNTVTATVVDGQCGPPDPPQSLTVVLTAM